MMPIFRNAAVFASVNGTVVLKKILENDGYFHILFFYHKIMNMKTETYTGKKGDCCENSETYQ